MPILVIREPVKTEELDSMLEVYGDFIKLAVDVSLCVFAGGGEMHADCEAVLLEKGSDQENIWGADWIPSAKMVEFTSFINIRPRQNNRSMEILNSEIRERVESIVRRLFDAK